MLAARLLSAPVHLQQQRVLVPYRSQASQHQSDVGLPGKTCWVVQADCLWARHGEGSVGGRWDDAPADRRIPPKVRSPPKTIPNEGLEVRIHTREFAEFSAHHRANNRQRHTAHDGRGWERTTWASPIIPNEDLYAQHYVLAGDSPPARRSCEPNGKHLVRNLWTHFQRERERTYWTKGYQFSKPTTTDHSERRLSISSKSGNSRQATVLVGCQLQQHDPRSQGSNREEGESWSTLPESRLRWNQTPKRPHSSELLHDVRLRDPTRRWRTKGPPADCEFYLQRTLHCNLPILHYCGRAEAAAVSTVGCTNCQPNIVVRWKDAEKRPYTLRLRDTQRNNHQDDISHSNRKGRPINKTD